MSLSHLQQSQMEDPRLSGIGNSSINFKELRHVLLLHETLSFQRAAELAELRGRAADRGREMEELAGKAKQAEEQLECSWSAASVWSAG